MADAHDTKRSSAFEILGTYFVNIIFNHIYQNAKLNIVGDTSLTDEYLRRVKAYVLGAKSDERCYRDLVQDVHKYFTSTTRFTTLSFSEFVDKIVGFCVPEEYFNQLFNKEKDELLGSILCDLIANLAVFATKPDVLRRIIDGHNSTPNVTIRMLQDSAVESLVNKRAELFNKFLKKKSQARDTVSADVLENMKGTIQKLVKEKAKVMAKLAQSEQDNQELLDEIHYFKVREAKYKKAIEMMKDAAKNGKAMAGAHVRAPYKENIAEPELVDITTMMVPAREDIAERRDGAENDEKTVAPISASFFKTGPIGLARPKTGPAAVAPTRKQREQREQREHKPNNKRAATPTEESNPIKGLLEASDDEMSDE